MQLLLQPLNLSGKINEPLFSPPSLLRNQWKMVSKTMGIKFTATHHPLSILPIVDELKSIVAD